MQLLPPLPKTLFQAYSCAAVIPLVVANFEQKSPTTDLAYLLQVLMMLLACVGEGAGTTVAEVFAGVTVEAAGAIELLLVVVPAVLIARVNE